MQAYQEKHQKQPSILNLIVITRVILVVIAYAILSLSTNDMLWFWPVFAETPSDITVYCYGDPVKIQSGTQEFNELATIFNESFSGYKNWDSLSMSLISWQDYQTNPAFATLVMTYPEPVRVHSYYKYFSSVNKLVMPLDGRHASSNPIFGVGVQRSTSADGVVTLTEVPGSGAFHIASKAPVMDYLTANGFCALP